MGFDPGALYTSRNHPRGLQMSIYAMSDALADLGLDWDQLAGSLPPDAVSVYVSSSMGQLDEAATGGMMTAGHRGERVSAKNCPLGFAEMPGDFINAYVLKSLGHTGPAGACATFLYNLQRGVDDIKSGRARIAVVGASEAPIIPNSWMVMWRWVRWPLIKNSGSCKGSERGSHPLPIGVSPVWGKLWVCDGRVGAGHDPHG